MSFEPGQASAVAAIRVCSIGGTFHVFLVTWPGRVAMGQMARAVRSLISVFAVAGGVYITFAVPLSGGRTLAQHVDEIGQTAEAKALVEDARESINPALDEVKDRVLGEYVEAPTNIPGAVDAEVEDRAEREGQGASDVSIYASGLEGRGTEPSLPGD